MQVDPLELAAGSRAIKQIQIITAFPRLASFFFPPSRLPSLIPFTYTLPGSSFLLFLTEYWIDKAQCVLLL
jgi:hypothetical protein